MRASSSATVSPGACSARIDADDCEIMQPWPVQAASTMRSPSSTSCRVTSSPHVGFSWRDWAVASGSNPRRRGCFTWSAMISG